MLLTTVLLWALNLSVTKYILTHGFAPLSYATVRYGFAGLIFVVLTLSVERTLRVERRHFPLLALAAVLLWLNQLSFVFAVDVTTASTVGLVLGSIPIFAAIFGLLLGIERPSRRFWLAASVSAGRCRPRGGRLGRRARPRPRRDPARARDGSDVGGLFRGRRTADALVFAVAR